MPSPPSPAVTEAASRVKAAYRAHACEPVFSSAVFVGDTEAVDGVVHAWGSQRDIAAKRKRATLQDFFVAPPSSGGADAAVRAGFAAEQPKGSISTFSPNGRYKVTFVTKGKTVWTTVAALACPSRWFAPLLLNVVLHGGLFAHGGR